MWRVIRPRSTHKIAVRSLLRKPARRKSSDFGGSSSSSGGSTVSEGVNALDHDAYPFRRLAQTQPGVIFASVTSDYRKQLGIRGFDGELTAYGGSYLISQLGDPLLSCLGLTPHLRAQHKIRDVDAHLSIHR